MATTSCGWQRCCGFLALLLASTAAQAGDIDFIDLYRNVGFSQTANGPVLAEGGSFFTTTVYTRGGVSYDSASLSHPGPASPQALLPQDVNQLGLRSATYTDRAAMDAAFPQGSYRYTLLDDGAATVLTVTLGADHYPLSMPYLAGDSYAALQGMNPAAPLTLQLSPFVTDSAATDSFVFFTVYDYTLGTFVFGDGFQPATTAQQTLPAGALQYGHTYAYELIYDTRIVYPVAGTDNGAQIGWELRTTGVFSTAVPEPAAALLLLAGLAATAARLRRSPALPLRRQLLAPVDQRLQ